MTALLGLLAALAALADGRPFGVRAIDQATGRGVPLVRLTTVHQVTFVTDSAGWAAFDEPGLFGLPVWLTVAADGYEAAADGFGMRGVRVLPVPGGEATVRLRRTQLAERLYRVTGAGRYRDSVLLGKPVPTATPTLNAQALGSDSVQLVRPAGPDGKPGAELLWFWGDTLRPGYPLGNFHMPGATSLAPGAGGPDPADAVELAYFTAADGFAAETANMPGEGPTWLSGLAEVAGPDGKPVLVAGYGKARGLVEIHARGLCRWDPAAARWRHLRDQPADAVAWPFGHPFRHADKDGDWLYFADPFPVLRTRPTLAAYSRPEDYEAWSAGPDGALAWRRGAAPLTTERDAELVKSGRLRPGAGVPRFRDRRDPKAAVAAHRGSLFRSARRGSWVMVFGRFGAPAGDAPLGETWFAEAPTPFGPWRDAVRIAAFARHSLYNPRWHPELSQGRMLYFEGTYTTLFAPGPPTPRYDYNQLMHRLDLDDPALGPPPGR